MKLSLFFVAVCLVFVAAAQVDENGADDKEVVNLMEGDQVLADDGDDDDMMMDGSDTEDDNSNSAGASPKLFGRRRRRWRVRIRVPSAIRRAVRRIRIDPTLIPGVPVRRIIRRRRS